MNRQDVITRLKSAEPALRERGVAALYLYGSYARDEARPDSDLDILVEFAPGQDRNLTRYLEPYHLLQDCFPETEIGYGTRENIVSHYRPYIEKSAIRIF